MTFASYLVLLSVWFAAICSPGPDLLCLVRIATRSRARGLAAAAGIVAGIVVWLVLTLAGLGALLAAAPWLLSALQIAGGAYLIWMGVSAVRAGARQLRSGGGSPLPPNDAHLSADPPPRGPRPESAGPDRRRPGLRGAFLQGLFTNLSNPKAVIFFGAVFSRFVTPGMGLADQIFMVVVLAAVSLAWFGGVAWGLGLPRFADTLHRAGPWIDVVSGAVFLVLATVIIAEGVASL